MFSQKPPPMLRPSVARLGKSMVTVRVGKENPEEFKVHKNILCAASPFFSNALNGPWRESREQVINLPEHEPEVFSFYQNFIYFKTLGVVEADARWNNIAQSDAWEKVLKLYHLAYYVQDTDVKDAAVDLLNDIDIWLAEKVQEIYDNTMPCAKIRLLCVDQFVHFNAGEDLKLRDRKLAKHLDEFPREFVAALLKESFEAREKGTKIVQRQVGCRYHEHVEKETPCYKEKTFPRE